MVDREHVTIGRETERVIEFVGSVIIPLSMVKRTMVLPDRSRHESVAEHSNAIVIFAATLAPKYDPGLEELDIGLMAQYLAVHDIIEIYAKDVTVWEPDEALALKPQTEALAARRIAQENPDMTWVMDTYTSYEQQDTPTKRYSYAIDKIYPHVQILANDHHPVHPSWEDYIRTERIAKEKIGRSYPALLPLFDDLCTRFREKPHFFSTPIPDNELPGAAARHE